jgi:hypothetical protein
MTEAIGRKRALRHDVKIAREAMSALAPLNRQIGLWQAGAARLVALGERHAGSGRYDPEAQSEARRLAALVAEQRAELLRRIAQLSSEGARSGRVVDTLRALDGLAAALERANALLEPRAEAIPPPRP